MRTYAIGDVFWSKIDKSGGEDACWPWMFAKNKRGYGWFHLPGTTATSVLAHRLAYSEVHGLIPDGISVLHKCDNPPCCNPKHLFLGSRRDNNEDMRVKGRAVNPPINRGASHGKSVLTEEQARKIILDPRKAPEVAKEYGVHKSTIHRLRQGKTYANL